MRSRLRDQRLTDEDRERLGQAYQQDIERRQRDLLKYMEDSVVHPNLLKGHGPVDFSSLPPIQEEGR
jgi:hypothetical protein